MALQRVSVHSSGRFLQTEDGAPFFWLGDTAWELFHRLTLAETEHYFDVRSRQGFNVIQAVILAEIDGLRTPNANGHVPLLGEDPERPNEFYFRHVDEVIRLPRRRGYTSDCFRHGETRSTARDGGSDPSSSTLRTPAVTESFSAGAIKTTPT